MFTVIAPHFFNCPKNRKNPAKIPISRLFFFGLRLIGLLLLLISGLSLHAQQVPMGVFYVPRLPEDIQQKQPQLLKQINQEIYKSGKTGQVYLTLDKYLHAYPGNSIRIIRMVTKDKLERYSYWSGPNAYGSSDFSQVTAAKAMEIQEVHQRYQFEDFFRDTLVILDSLKLKVFLPELSPQTMPIFSNSSGVGLHQEIKKNKALLIRLTEPGKSGSYFTVDYRLKNSVALKCAFYFLSEQDKIELSGVKRGLQERVEGVSGLTEEEVSLALNQYISERFGTVKGWDTSQIKGL